MAKLYFYYSAMNAGKTTTLLQSAHNYRERGMRTLILTPKLDHRAGSGVVASRIGLRADGRIFERDTGLQQLVERDIHNDGALHCVLVDEAQFLSRAQVWQLSEVVDRLRVPVLCYGLRTDFRGELFEGSQFLLAWADELEEIKTICHSGSKATMTVRVDAQGTRCRTARRWRSAATSAMSRSAAPSSRKSCAARAVSIHCRSPYRCRLPSAWCGQRTCGALAAAVYRGRLRLRHLRSVTPRFALWRATWCRARKLEQAYCTYRASRLVSVECLAAVLTPVLKPTRLHVARLTFSAANRDPSTRIYTLCRRC